MNPFSIGVRSRVSAMAVCWSVAIFLGTELCSRPATAQEGQTSPSREYLQDDIQSFPAPPAGESPTFDGFPREFRPPVSRGERVMPSEIMRPGRSRQMPFELRIAQLMQIKTILEKHGQKDIARQLEPLILQLRQEQNCSNRVTELKFAAEGLRALGQPQLADQLSESIKEAEAELEELRSKGKAQPEIPVSVTPAQPEPAAPGLDSTVTPVPVASPADKLKAEIQQLQQQTEDLKAQIEVLNKKLEEQTKTEEAVTVSGGGFF